jgi:hypothetical protein
MWLNVLRQNAHRDAQVEANWCDNTAKPAEGNGGEVGDRMMSLSQQTSKAHLQHTVYG